MKLKIADIFITSEEEWLPYSQHFEELENQAKDQGIKISAMTIDSMEYSDIAMSQLKIMSTQVVKKNLVVSEQELAKRWSIGIKDAENTGKVTSQKFIRNALHPIE